jgi:hypothetical protein
VIWVNIFGTVDMIPYRTMYVGLART